LYDSSIKFSIESDSRPITMPLNENELSLVREKYQKLLAEIELLERDLDDEVPLDEGTLKRTFGSIHVLALDLARDLSGSSTKVEIVWDLTF